VALEVLRTLLEWGFIVVQRPGLRVLRLDPSLTISRDDVYTFLESLVSVLAEL